MSNLPSAIVPCYTPRWIAAGPWCLNRSRGQCTGRAHCPCAAPWSLLQDRKSQNPLQIGYELRNETFSSTCAAMNHPPRQEGFILPSVIECKTTVTSWRTLPSEGWQNIAGNTRNGKTLFSFSVSFAWVQSKSNQAPCWVIYHINLPCDMYPTICFSLR